VQGKETGNYGNQGRFMQEIVKGRKEKSPIVYIRYTLLHWCMKERLQQDAQETIQTGMELS